MLNARYIYAISLLVLTMLTAVAPATAAEYFVSLKGAWLDVPDSRSWGAGRDTDLLLSI